MQWKRGKKSHIAGNIDGNNPEHCITKTPTAKRGRASPSGFTEPEHFQPSSLPAYKSGARFFRSGEILREPRNEKWFSAIQDVATSQYLTVTIIR